MTDKASPRDPLKPSATVLIKLGSLAVHVDEMLSKKGHPFDRITIQGILTDTEVKDWLEQMDELAFLPVKR